MTEGTSILWRRLDLSGHELATLTSHDGGWTLAGTVLVAHEGRPCQLRYTIECDDAWRTRAAQILGHLGGAPVALKLTRDADGAWQSNGALVPSVHGCVDVDLGFSPSTNLLPIRRLQLAVGDSAAVRAAWVRFPELTLEVLEQSYTRTGDATYVYESAGGAFRRELSVSPDGFVLDYPGLWRVETWR